MYQLQVLIIPDARCMEYWPTFTHKWIDPHVDQYSSTIEHMGLILSIISIAHSFLLLISINGMIMAFKFINESTRHVICPECTIIDTWLIMTLWYYWYILSFPICINSKWLFIIWYIPTIDMATYNDSYSFPEGYKKLDAVPLGKTPGLRGRPERLGERPGCSARSAELGLPEIGRCWEPKRLEETVGIWWWCNMFMIN